MDEKNVEMVKEYVLRRLAEELPSGLYYHGLEHTRDDVVPAVEAFAKGEGIQGESLYLLLTAAWFHDTGFIEQRVGHELVSVRIASETLPGFGYGEEQIQIIKGIILATVIPQFPVTLLEKTMADADLNVFGRDDFLQRNNDLRRELAYFGKEFTDMEWYTSQVNFMEAHNYFTASAHRARDNGKTLNIANLKQKLEGIKAP